MNNYAILCIAFLLGQASVSSVKALMVEAKNPLINYGEAFKIVFKKSIGSYIVGVVAVWVAIFLMPEFFKNVLELDDAKKLPEGSKMAFVVKWFRFSAYIFGIGAQTILIATIYKVNEAVAKLIDKKSGE